MTYRGTYADDFPSRETALSILAALKTADSWREVEIVTGRDRAQFIADRCFMVYGYPELDPTALAIWTASAFDRRMSGNAQASPPSTSETPVRDTYGFQPRR